jgi:hypothetical protein
MDEEGCSSVVWTLDDTCSFAQSIPAQLLRLRNAPPPSPPTVSAFSSATWRRFEDGDRCTCATVPCNTVTIRPPSAAVLHPPSEHIQLGYGNWMCSPPKSGVAGACTRKLRRGGGLGTTGARCCAVTRTRFGHRTTRICSDEPETTAPVWWTAARQRCARSRLCWQVLTTQRLHTAAPPPPICCAARKRERTHSECARHES